MIFLPIYILFYVQSRSCEIFELFLARQLVAVRFSYGLTYVLAYFLGYFVVCRAEFSVVSPMLCLRKMWTNLCNFMIRTGLFDNLYATSIPYTVV